MGTSKFNHKNQLHQSILNNPNLMALNAHGVVRPLNQNLQPAFVTVMCIHRCAFGMVASCHEMPSTYNAANDTAQLTGQCFNFALREKGVDWVQVVPDPDCSDQWRVIEATHDFEIGVKFDEV